MKKNNEIKEIKSFIGGIKEVTINDIKLTHDLYLFKGNLIKGSEKSLTIKFKSSELWYRFIDNIQDRYNVIVKDYNFDETYTIPETFTHMKYYFTTGENKEDFYGYYVIFT